VKIFSRLLLALLAVAFSTAWAKGGHGGHGGHGCKGNGGKHASARGHGGGGWSARPQRDADPGPETPNVALDPPARPAPRR